MNIDLHFLSFLNIEMVQGVEIFFVEFKGSLSYIVITMATDDLVPCVTR